MAEFGLTSDNSLALNYLYMHGSGWAIFWQHSLDLMVSSLEWLWFGYFLVIQSSYEAFYLYAWLRLS